MGDSLDGLHPEHRKRVISALADPRLKGVWFVVSACRTNAEQKRLYAAYKAGRGPLAAAPGRSPHEVGASKGDGYCHATDLGRVTGNPPGGYIPNRRGGRHADWALLEDVCNDHGLARTVAKEEWHYSVSGSPTVVIPPRPPQPRRTFMAQLSDAEQRQLLQMTREIHHALFSTKPADDPGLAYKIKYALDGINTLLKRKP